MTKIIIGCPFWSAGDKYGWTEDGYDRRGIGIRADLLGNRVLEIEIDKEPYVGQIYSLDCAVARFFVSKYKSDFVAKGVPLKVVSLSLLTNIQ